MLDCRSLMLIRVMDWYINLMIKYTQKYPEAVLGAFYRQEKSSSLRSSFYFKRLAMAFKSASLCLKLIRFNFEEILLVAIRYSDLVPLTFLIISWQYKISAESQVEPFLSLAIQIMLKASCWCCFELSKASSAIFNSFRFQGKIFYYMGLFINFKGKFLYPSPLPIYPLFYFHARKVFLEKKLGSLGA